MKEKLFDENQSLSYRKTFLESNCQEEVEKSYIRDMVIEDQITAIRDISTDIAIIEQ